jgi:hypothetical protein
MRCDPVMEEMRAIRRHLSNRLFKAYREGRLEEEVRALCREGRQALRENGRRSSERQRTRRSSP